LGIEVESLTSPLRNESAVEVTNLIRNIRQRGMKLMKLSAQKIHRHVCEQHCIRNENWQEETKYRTGYKRFQVPVMTGSSAITRERRRATNERNHGPGRSDRGMNTL
jgi:hypothetical protein